MLLLIVQDKLLISMGGSTYKLFQEQVINREFLRLDGLWDVTTVKTQDLPKQQINGDLVMFIGNVGLFDLKIGKWPVCVALQITPTANPREMDFTYVDGSGNYKIVYAVYRLEPDTLRICLSRPGEGRPSELAAPHGAGEVVVVLKRIRP